MARDAGVALRLCMATVPPASTALTYASPAESPYPSFREFAHGPILPFASIKLFGEYCFPRDQLYVSPSPARPLPDLRRGCPRDSHSSRLVRPVYTD